MKNRRRKRQRQDRGGFTLLEVLLVLVILVVLGTMAGLAVNQARKKALQTSAQAQIGLFEGPLDAFEMDMRRYPTTQEGLTALRTAPSSSSSKWAGPYINKDIPSDPWDGTYEYAEDGSGGYTITSNGRDQAAGTDDDITISKSL